MYLNIQNNGSTLILALSLILSVCLSTSWNKNPLVGSFLMLHMRRGSLDGYTFEQLMHMELDRLNREMDIKFTRKDALDMRKVPRVPRIFHVFQSEPKLFRTVCFVDLSASF